ncbi:MAG: rhodanese-like domain-containing protein [Deltaproteobacteria bacterium]|nr:rhodanese-like domain-containing protein [Deltaproteobacteria bacterium]
MKKFLFFVAAAGLVLAIVLSSFGAAGDQPLIIDVRTEAEWNSGHLEGAVWIPYDVIGEKIGAIAKDKSARIYVYCRSGRRSQIAKEALLKLGYRDIVNLGSVDDAARTMKRKIVK